MQVTTVGLDLAKNIFQVHGATDCGEVAFNRALRRSQVLAFFERLEPCLIGMEACSTSHYWARELLKRGHDVKPIPPVYIKPYVKRGKSDTADAEAICEAVTRPTMRFVEAKTLCGLSVPHHVAETAKAARYNTRVYWDEIFTQDTERKQIGAEAEAP